ncbi:MAG: hypothetical protein M1815_001724 [Lichina confinis]|nr:MAG: hypothetical protein M1815_001724 [Lichina confinis]
MGEELRSAPSRPEIGNFGFRYEEQTWIFIFMVMMVYSLEGSCQCGAVEFTVDSHTPVPYQLCACTICRKVGGYGGAVNLGAMATTLKVKSGEEDIRKYHAIADRGTPDEKRLQSERAFCVHCATMLWVYDSQWPELIHPFASAIDTPLPPPDEMVCVMACSKPDWVRWPDGEKQVYDKYGPDSIEDDPQQVAS